MKKYILGNIRKIIFESNTGPYKVGLFKVKETNDEELNEYVNKVIGFTGSFSDVNENIDYIFYGEMVNHPKYGLQYSVSSYEISTPSDKDGLVLYLSSGLFKGIGEKTARKIVDKFGSDTIDVIKNNYEELSLISGMNIKKARVIHDGIVSSEMNQDLIIKLTGYGFTMKESIDLSTMYGLEVLKIIDENIYELIDYVSFNKLDSIYLNNGNYEMSSIRVKALIKHNIYTMCYESGDTLIYKDELFIRIKRCFNENLDSNTFVQYIDELVRDSELVEVSDKVMLYDFYEAENNIIHSINRLGNIKSDYNSKKIDEYISKYEKKYEIVFNKDQKNAISESIKNNFYIISGGPGTGKTTIIKAIVEILEELNKLDKREIALLAPTGKSAKRMSESVGAPAYTIHKFLKWNKETETFGLDEYNKAGEKVIIVDEASMIDIFLFSALLKALRINAKLLLIGDSNQLPSIAPGDVLNDLLNFDNVKYTYLNTIYRVKEGSYITYLAKDIKEKKEFDHIDNSYDDFKFIESSDDNIRIYLTEICNKVKNKKIKIENFQVLAPMYKGLNGIDNLNEMLSNIFNPNEEKYLVGDKYYRIGDKVIQLINDVENNVFNGDIGYIYDIEVINKKMEITIDFEGNKVKYKQGEFDRFNLAYAISIHKSQGSEYDNVVVILAKSFKRMFYNKLIYTGVTRAKSSLIIIGSLDSFNSSIQTSYAEKRNTYLKTYKMN